MLGQYPVWNYEISLSKTRLLSKLFNKWRNCWAFSWNNFWNKKSLESWLNLILIKNATKKRSQTEGITLQVNGKPAVLRRLPKCRRRIIKSDTGKRPLTRNTQFQSVAWIICSTYKASPPCPPSNRLLNVFKLGVNQEENTEAKKAQTKSDIEIDLTG